MEIICYSCGRGENPENSIEGIRNCQKVNPDWRIEMDLQMTKDGHIVLFHDKETERITGVEKEIQNLTLEEVQILNAGYNFTIGSSFPYRETPIEIPTLDEVCKAFPKIKLLLDVHTNNVMIINTVISIVERYRMAKQIVVVSQFDEILAGFKAKRPNWEYGAATKEVKNMVYSSLLFLDGFFPIQSNILMLPIKYNGLTLLTKRVIRHIRKRDKKLWVWLNEGKEVVTINSNHELMELKEKGVDGIFTEFPAKLMKEISEK